MFWSPTTSADLRISKPAATVFTLDIYGTAVGFLPLLLRPRHSARPAEADLSASWLGPWADSGSIGFGLIPFGQATSSKLKLRAQHKASFAGYEMKTAAY